jgi:uncharacterized protein YjdB
MSAALRRERAWRYAAADPTGDVTATTWAIARADTADGAYWVAYAPQNGRESTVALRRTAIGRAVFTVADGVPVLDSDLWRLQRTGTLYTVTGVRPVPTARETVFDAETVERGQYAITADVEAFTATAVYIDPPSVTMSAGPNAARRLRATVTNAQAVVLQDRPVVWTSSDYSVALIDAQGRLEGVLPGTATITATAGDAVGTCTVTVL